MITFTSVVFCAALLTLTIAGGVAVVLVLMRREGFRGAGRQQSEETRTIQELHNQLSRMEARIEALETIIIEDHGKASNEKS